MILALYQTAFGLILESGIDSHQPSLVPLNHLPEPNHYTSSEGSHLILWIGRGARARLADWHAVKDTRSPLAQLNDLGGMLGDKSLFAVGTRGNVQVHQCEEKIQQCCCDCGFA